MVVPVVIAQPDFAIPVNHHVLKRLTACAYGMLAVHRTEAVLAVGFVDSDAVNVLFPFCNEPSSMRLVNFRVYDADLRVYACTETIIQETEPPCFMWHKKTVQAQREERDVLEDCLFILWCEVVAVGCKLYVTEPVQLGEETTKLSMKSRFPPVERHHRCRVRELGDDFREEVFIYVALWIFHFVAWASLAVSIATVC